MFVDDSADVEVEPSLFVNSGEEESSSPWQHVHIDPETTSDKLQNASGTRTLHCTPCEASVLPEQYCRAHIGICNISNQPGGHTTNVDPKELQDRISQAVDILRSSISESPASLSWSDVTVRAASSP